MYRSQSGAEQQHLLQQQHHQQQQQFGGYPQVHNQQQQQQQQSQESSVLSGSETMTDYAGIPFPSGEQQHYNHDSQQRGACHDFLNFAVFTLLDSWLRAHFG